MVNTVQRTLLVSTIRTRKGTSTECLLRTATTRRKAGDTASARRIRVVGRFASPSCSRETSPIDGGYNSSDSDDPCPTLRNTLQPRLVPNEDPNDADDEAEINKELAERGRSRVIRRVSVSSR